MVTNNIRGKQKQLFLEHFRVCGNVSWSAAVAGIARKTVYNWQEHDEAFAVAYKQAEIEATEFLERVAHERATQGVSHPRNVYDRSGNLVVSETVTEYSDRLLELLLKARAPNKYRERMTIDYGNYSTEQLIEEGRRLGLVVDGAGAATN